MLNKKIESEKKEIIDDLKFLITLQILFVVIVSYMVQFVKEMNISNIETSIIIRVTYPIAFLLFSMFFIRYSINSKTSIDLFYLKKSINWLKILINIYLLNFGMLIISICFIFENILLKMIQYILNVYILTLIISIIIPMLILIITIFMFAISKNKIK